MKSDLQLPIACTLVVASFYLASDRAAHLSRPADMTDVETMLAVDHGLPVAGFAQTPAVDLGALDKLVPAACVEIVRKTYLAKLAVLRMAPAHAADADGVANAVRFTLTADRPECAP